MVSMCNPEDYDIALSRACVAGHTDDIQKLVAEGADINARDRSRYASKFVGYSVPVLFNAVEKQHVEAVRLLLKLGVFVPAIDKFGRNSLHLACAIGNKDIVQLLLDNRADVNSVEHNSLRPIHIASSHGYSDIVKLLVDYGSLVNVNDIMGHTPLYNAAENGHESVVAVLMENGAFVHMDQETFTNSPLEIAYLNFRFSVIRSLLKFDPDLTENVGLVVSKLHLTASLSDVKEVLRLLKSGCSIHAEDTKGRTLLHIACKIGCLDLVKMCLCRDMDVNKQDNNGLTPLHYACEGMCESFCNLTSSLETRLEKRSRNAQVEEVLKNENNVWTQIADFLLESGAVVNGCPEGCSRADWTPLCHACYSGNISIVKLLIHQGADVNEGPERFPLHTAVAACHVEAVKILMANKAHINLCQGFDAFYPVHLAVNFEQEAIVKMLLDAGADPNVKDKSTRSAPIHFACYTKCNSTNIINLLFKSGADPNILNNLTDTALHETCRSNLEDIELIKRLIEGGVDVNIQNFRKKIPLHYACRRGNVKAIKILLRASSKTQVVDKDLATPLVTLLDNYMTLRNMLSSQTVRAMLPLINAACPSYIWSENYTWVVHQLYKYGRPVVGILIPACCGSSEDIVPSSEFLKMLWFNHDFEFLELMVESGFNISESALLEMFHSGRPGMGISVQNDKEMWLSTITECRSLQSFCRQSIRRHIFMSLRRGQLLNLQISGLPLPGKLRKYLLFYVEYAEDDMVDNG